MDVLSKENLMNAQRLALMIGCVLGLAVAAHAADKISKEKLLGAWLCTEGKHIEGAVVEFAKDGKGTVTHTKDGKTVKEEFRYEIDGDTVKVMVKDKDGNEMTMPHKITKLTDKEMVAEDDKGEVAKFKKKTD
jgi:uncharacterized protein (TIGR03066 family)